jgi:hypothetical protein
MTELEVITKFDDIPKDVIKGWLRDAVKNRCETIEEINGYIMYRYDVRISYSKRIEFASAVRKMVPFILDEMDRRYGEGKDLNFIVKSTDFLLAMGEGSRKFAKIGYIKVSNNIRQILLKEGINIHVFTKKHIGYYLFRALTDDDVKTLEERYRKNSKKMVCRQMTRKICDQKIHGEDDESVWNDAEFIRNIGRCTFSVERIEDKVKRKKEILFYDRIRNGIELLF